MPEQLDSGRLKRQSKQRRHARNHKLRFAFCGYAFVLLLVAMVQAIAVWIFSLGFLLSRDVLPNISEDIPLEIPLFDKAVVLVIDALRFDFAVPIPGSSQYYHNSLPVLHEMAQNNDAFLLKFMADPPTTTLQRLKGLTTGSLPTFVDAGSNFAGDAIAEDNWILQLHRHGKKIAFMGDDTWQALFSSYFAPGLDFPYPSLNVADLHTVDNGVIEHLFPLLDQKDKWDVLIGHFLGADHVGHRYGPNHFSMREKLSQMNQVICDVVQKLDENTLLVIMGDHGMDPTGNHGGDSPLELELTLFMYAKNHSFNKRNASHYDISHEGRNHPSVAQIDLVPTMSLLLGLPIPYNNLGFPIREAFGTLHHFAHASYALMHQLLRFRQRMATLSPDITSKYDEFVAKFRTVPDTDADCVQLAAEARAYQQLSLAECHRLWAQFEMVLIVIGLVLAVLACAFLATYARSLPAVRVATLQYEFLSLAAIMALLGLVISVSVYVVMRPVEFGLRKTCLVGLAAGTIVGLWNPIINIFSVQWLYRETVGFFSYGFNAWLLLAIVFICGHCMVFASNLYVVWEDKMSHFFVSTFGLVCAIRAATDNRLKRYDRIILVTHALVFTVLSRAVSTINLCREEQQPYCTRTFEVTWWSVLLLFVQVYALPATIARFYRLHDSYHLAAPVWIAKVFRFLLSANAAYWLIEYLQNTESALSLMQMVPAALWTSLKLAIARLSMGVALVFGNILWMRGPLCILVATNPSSPNQVVVRGDENIYGASYLLLVLNFVPAIMLVTRPIGAVTFGILLAQILSLLEIFRILGIRRNIVCPTMFLLLGFQHFFASGHHATILSIKWETAFITTESIVFPISHLNIFLNTFGSFLIVALCLPLIALWGIRASKPVTILAQVVTDATTFLTYNLLLGISSLGFLAHFRRHLMVWKVFAPRFMLSGILIVSLNLVIIMVLFIMGTGRLVSQVNRIFALS